MKKKSSEKKRFSQVFRFFKPFMPHVLVTAFFMLGIFTPLSCQATEDGISIISGDFSFPKIKSFKVLGMSDFALELSKNAELKDCKMKSKNTDDVWPYCSVYKTVENEDGSIVLYISSLSGLFEGYEYSVSGKIVDSWGNSNTFSIDFVSYNSLLPLMVISEVRNAYGTVSSGGKAVKKGEFVELLCLSSGYCAGLELVSVHDGIERAYTFSNKKVKRGDYITVHMRCIDNGDSEEMKFEDTDEKSNAKATDTCDSAIDLWSSNTKACIGETDIIYIRDIQSGKIMTALPFVKVDSISQWNDEYDKLACEINENGLWLDQEGKAKLTKDTAFNADNITPSALTRSISRQNCDELLEKYTSMYYMMNTYPAVPSSAKDFIVTKSVRSDSVTIPGVTPGLPNSNNAY